MRVLLNSVFKSRILAERLVNRKLMTELFDIYLDNVKQGDESSAIYSDFLLNMSDRYRSNTLPVRAVADFIAGMTDSYSLDQYVVSFMPDKIGYVIQSE